MHLLNIQVVCLTFAKIRQIILDKEFSVRYWQDVVDLDVDIFYYPVGEGRGIEIGGALGDVWPLTQGERLFFYHPQ